MVATLLLCWTKWLNYSQASFGYTRETAEPSSALPPAQDLWSERSLWSQKINTPIISVISGSKNCHKRLEQTVPPAVFMCQLCSTLVKKQDKLHKPSIATTGKTYKNACVLQKEDWFQRFLHELAWLWTAKQPQWQLSWWQSLLKTTAQACSCSSTTRRDSHSLICEPALQQPQDRAPQPSEGFLPPSPAPRAHSPPCRAGAQICKRKPRHPPGPSLSSLFGGTILGPWLFYAHSRTAC